MNEKLSIIIPYRDRKNHLDEFIPYMNKFLKTNIQNEFNIIVVEQANDNLFNRGSLINIGFDLEKNNCTYIAPHDVDLLQEQSNYSKPINPTHLAAYRSQKNYILEYDSFFGGVNLFLNDDFAKLNADKIKVTQATFSTVATGANIRFCFISDVIISVNLYC